MNFSPFFGIFFGIFCTNTRIFVGIQIPNGEQEMGTRDKDEGKDRDMSKYSNGNEG